MIGGPYYNYRLWRGMTENNVPRHWRSAPKRGKKKPTGKRGKRK